MHFPESGDEYGWYGQGNFIVLYTRTKTAVELEFQTDEQIIHLFLSVLRKIFVNVWRLRLLILSHHQVFIQEIGEPKKVLITRWFSDPFSRGSYSNIPDDADPEMYDHMTEPEGLFFERSSSPWH